MMIARKFKRRRIWVSPEVWRGLCTVKANLDLRSFDFVLRQVLREWWEMRKEREEKSKEVAQTASKLTYLEVSPEVYQEFLRVKAAMGVKDDAEAMDRLMDFFEKEVKPRLKKARKK